MPTRSLDPELRHSLAKAALDGLDHLLTVAPPGDSIRFREISAQVRLIRDACPCGTAAAPKGCKQA